MLTAVAGKTTNGILGGHDGRGKKSSSNKTTDEQIAFVKAHIESFPRTESHYCRKETQRQYLDSTLSINKMYTLYGEKCKAEIGEHYKCVSLAMYRCIFVEQYNLGFFHPKKDQCSECAKYSMMSADQKASNNTMDKHLQRSKEAQADKANDKERANKDQTFRSVTFDLQSVLQVPSSDVSLMYYKRKLCCYNFTIYEQAKPNDAYCFFVVRDRR